MDAKEEEEIIFGWVLFPSKEIRDIANKKAPYMQFYQIRDNIWITRPHH
ncbi:DUF1428 domain-containing protein [Arenibacter nanhaiticus]